MRYNRFFLIIFLLNYLASYAQEVYYISDTSFLSYLKNSIPQTIRNDSLIIDSAILYMGDVVIDGEFNLKNIDGLQFFKHTPYIEIDNCLLNSMPKLASDSLLSLRISNTHLTLLPELDSLPNLNSLSLANDSLINIPDLKNLKSLSRFAILNEPLRALPSLDSLSKLTDIEFYFYTANRSFTLSDLSDKKHLEVLACVYCGLNSLPSINGLPEIQELYLSNNNLTSLPSVSGCTGLQWLECSYNSISILPNLDSNFALQRLDCSHNQLVVLPAMSQLVNLFSLDASFNQLSMCPDITSILTLQYVDLSHNKLKSFPELNPLFKPAMLYLNDNLISHLPTYTSYLIRDSFYQVDLSRNKLDFSDAYSLWTYDHIISYSKNYFYAGMTNDSTYLNYTFQNPFGLSDTTMVLTYADTTLSISAQLYADDYQWYHNGQSIPGANDPILNIYYATQTDAGEYTCHSIGDYFDRNNFRFKYGATEFVSEPQTLLVSPITAKFNLIKVYPVVNTGSFFLKYVLPDMQGVNVEIYDISGRKVFEKSIEAMPKGEYTENIVLSSVAAGIYISKVIFSKGYENSSKIVVVRN